LGSYAKAEHWAVEFYCELADANYDADDWTPPYLLTHAVSWRPMECSTEHHSVVESPAFDARVAIGTPLLWNDKSLWSNFGRMVWKLRWTREPTITDIEPRIAVVLDWLRLRTGRDGRSVVAGLGDPVLESPLLWRIPFLSFPGYDRLPTSSSGIHAHHGRAEWERAFHGTHAFAVYSILYHERLIASENESKGHRTLKDTPGIYCYKEELREKCFWYAEATCLNQEGVYWRFYFELAVDRAGRQAPGVKTDQWVQASMDSVRFVNLYVQGSTAVTLAPGDVLHKWHSQLEANPANWSP
jgi:hypothetical protein